MSGQRVDEHRIDAVFPAEFPVLTTEASRILLEILVELTEVEPVRALEKEIHDS